MKETNVNKIFYSLLILCIQIPSAIAGDILHDARTTTQGGPNYQYKMEFRSNDMAFTAIVNTKNTAGRKIKLSASSGDVKSSEFREKIAETEREADAMLWCSQFLKSIPDNARLASQDSKQAVYHFQPVSDENASKEDIRFNQNSSGIAVFDVKTKQLLSYRLSATKTFKINMMAEISHFEQNATCAPSPDGRAYLASLITEVKGSMMFQSFEKSDYIIISNLQ